MNGYLTFLKNLSEYQQRAEIGHLVFVERQGGSSLEEDLLKMPAVVAYCKTLRVDPSLWKLELKHYAEEADLIGTPVFAEGQCRASFTFRYLEDKDAANRTLRVIRAYAGDLVVTGMIYINDDQSAIITTLGASATREPSCAREWRIAAGINPDTNRPVSHDAGLASQMPYLDFLESLLPQQRREAIFDLSSEAWGTDNPQFLDHPKLAPELGRLDIEDLDEADLCHQVGPVEFAERSATAPIWYSLYGESPNAPLFGYYARVHILARIANHPSGGGATLSIDDLWFRIESIDNLSDELIPMLVP